MIKSIHELADKLAHIQSKMIDSHLAKFLTENGFDVSVFTLEAIQEELRNKGFEIIHEFKRDVASVVHTFKLVKVYDSTSLVIPTPQIYPNVDSRG